MAFDYQTTQSTLLGALDELRVPAMNNLYDYMPVLSGSGELGVQLDVQLDDESDGALGGLGSVDYRTLAIINAANPRAVVRSDLDNEKESVEITAINKLNDFLGFSRRPGQRDVGGRVLTNFTKRHTFRTLIGDDDTDDRRVTQELWFPLSFIIANRDKIGDAPDDFALNLVKARGDAMTDQEIEVERQRVTSQKAEQDRSNKLANEQAPSGRARSGLKKKSAVRPKPTPPPPPPPPAVVAASEQNKKSSVSLGWGINLHQYAGGPGDVALAKDVAIFQKVAGHTINGIVDKPVLIEVKAIRTRVIKEGKSAKVDPSILKFTNAIQIKDFADPRTAGGVTQVVYEKKYGDAPSAKPVKEAVAAKKVAVAKKKAAVAAPAKVSVAPVALTAEQLASARAANKISSGTLRWSTAPGVYSSASDAALARDVAFVQAKYRISGAAGVVTAGLLAKIKAQQLAGLGALAVDNADTMGAVTRLMSGVVMTAGEGPMRLTTAQPSSDTNWLLIGGAVAAVGALVYGIMSMRGKAPSRMVVSQAAPKPLA